MVPIKMFVEMFIGGRVDLSFLALGEVVSEGGWFGNNSIVFPFTRYLHSILINLFL